MISARSDWNIMLHNFHLISNPAEFEIIEHKEYYDVDLRNVAKVGL